MSDNEDRPGERSSNHGKTKAPEKAKEGSVSGPQPSGKWFDPDSQHPRDRKKCIGFAILLGAILSALLLVCVRYAPPAKNSLLHDMLKTLPPWLQLAGAAVAPMLLLLWYWRDRFRDRDLELQEQKNNLEQDKLDWEKARAREATQRQVEAEERAAAAQQRVVEAETRAAEAEQKLAASGSRAEWARVSRNAAKRRILKLIEGMKTPNTPPARALEHVGAMKQMMSDDPALARTIAPGTKGVLTHDVEEGVRKAVRELHEEAAEIMWKAVSDDEFEAPAGAGGTNRTAINEALEVIHDDSKTTDEKLSAVKKMKKLLQSDPSTTDHILVGTNEAAQKMIKAERVRDAVRTLHSLAEFAKEIYEGGTQENTPD